MKKKIIILLLLFIIFPIKAEATLSFNTRINVTYRQIDYFDSDYFPIFSIETNGSSEYLFSLNSNAFDYIYNSRKYNYISNIYYNSRMQNSDLTNYSSITSNNKLKLIQKVLEHGNVNGYTSSQTSDAYAVSKQIIILEILNGQRTSFNAENPELPEENQSIYYKKIKNNRNNSLFTRNVYESYSSIIKSITNDEINLNDYTRENPLYLYRKYTNGSYLYSNEIKFDSQSCSNCYVDYTDYSINVNMYQNYFQVSTGLYTPDTRSFYIRKVTGTTNPDYESAYVFDTSYSNFVLGKKYTNINKKIYVKTANDLQIRTVDSNNNLINGATYQIFNSDNVQIPFEKINNNYVYNKNGEATILNSGNSIIVYGLPNGNYILRVMSIPNGYTKVNNEDIHFIVNDNNIRTTNQSSSNNIINVSFKTATTVVILDPEPIPDDPSQPVSNVYKLVDENGSEVKLTYDSSTGSYKYDPNGVTEIAANDENKIFFSNLPSGSYKLIKDGKEKVINVSNSNFNVISSSNSGELVFYNLNENGSNLKGGKFKIQKYNSSIGSYVEAGVTKVSDSEYKLDSNSKSSEFTMKESSVKFTNIESNTKYRIIQLTPPDGYEITSIKEAQMDVEIDEQGYPTSTAMIINKSIIVGTQASDNAELILSINTGQKVKKYGIIIRLLIIVITTLFVIRRKKK